ncbi:MAG: hypothetical protein LUI14_15200 [Lachnospiraceae bacterium]|nr:hypothetical protein [Lachnospiraceae bacterium]
MLQQMYNVIDTWVVGNFIGSDALAGVGSAYTLMIFLTSILLGLCMGSSVVFSLCFGQKDEQKLKESVGTAFLPIAAVTVLLTAIPILALDNILAWINIPQEILTLTKEYLFNGYFAGDSCCACLSFVADFFNWGDGNLVGDPDWMVSGGYSRHRLSDCEPKKNSVC